MKPMYLWRCLVVYTSFMQHYTMSLLQKCLVTISEEKLSNFVLCTKLKFSYFSSHCGTDIYIYIYIYIKWYLHFANVNMRQIQSLRI